MATTNEGTATSREVEIRSGSRHLRGILTIPAGARGIVVFAHGSGSGRHSPRNQFVASVLQDRGLATLLVDLLEEGEEEDRRKVFDIRLLAGRLQDAAAWLRQAEGGEVDLNHRAEHIPGVSEAYLEGERRHQLGEIARRRGLFRQARPPAVP